MLSLFDFPNVTERARQGAGGLMHLALSLPQERWEQVRAALDRHRVSYQRIDDSIYLHDPDGMMLEMTLL